MLDVRLVDKETYYLLLKHVGKTKTKKTKQKKKKKLLLKEMKEHTSNMTPVISSVGCEELFGWHW
jgi:hypothetical protein